MQKSSIIILAIGVVVVGGLLFGAAKLGNTSTTTNTEPTQEDTTVEQSAELQSEDIKVGDGAEATANSTVSVHYVGTLPDGTQFDSSRDRGQPFETTLGQGNVIQGWDEGLVGMKVGGVRKLTVPPSMGYGDQANGSIPANSTLIFEVELMAVK